MFQFIYKGRFDCLITKEMFEAYVKNIYSKIQKELNITMVPKKFIVTMEMDSNKPKGYGGYTDYDRKTDIIYYLNLQLFGYPKKEQTFELMQGLFENILIHEMLHFFIPSVKNNSCWTEGVTEFMTFWYLDIIDETLLRLENEYKEIKDAKYKEHKYGYLIGFKKMVKLYNEDKTVINIMKKIIKDFNKNSESKQKEYLSSDIISYDKRFKTFFTGKCNHHIEHKLS